ncbi:MAG: diacylglycerol kinase family protein [Eubacteriales bacterium]|nr:diacylglycerol kinase family protein [Eubacteriales bacterium]
MSVLQDERDIRMYHFIINSAASSGKGAEVWQKAESILKRENAEYTAHFPKSGEHTDRLVRKLTETPSSEDCHLVVLGGDGTLNLVLQGIVSFEHTTLSCIRTGSGNDFAKDMGLERDLERALLHLLYDSQETMLDYGILTAYPTDDSPVQKRFLISSGVGYDADICEEVSRSRLKKVMNRLHLGKLVYVCIGIRQIFTRKTCRAVLRLEGQEKRYISGLFFLVGMIHPYEGGGVPFCPEADPADGYLDLCVVEGMAKWKLLLAVIFVYLKKHYLFRGVTAFRCRSLTLTLDKPQWFHMDGETPFKIRKISMECKSGLRFVQ